MRKLLLCIALAGCSAPSEGSDGAAAQDLAGADLVGTAGADLAGTDLATTAGPHRWVMGYYTGYQAKALPVAEIDWTALSHLAIAFYLPDGAGGLDEQLSIDPTAGPALGHALVAAGHAAGRKVVASIGGSTAHDTLAASAKAATRAKFVARIVKLVGDYGFDGVDLDWEPIASADVGDLVALATALRAALPGTTLTIPVNTRNYNLMDDLSFAPQLAAVFDQVNLMSYGMAGTYTGWKSWHSAPLHWNHDTTTPTGIDDSIDAYLATGVAAAKLGVGSGFYGLCYSSPVKAPAQALGGSAIVADDGTMSYAHIMSAYYSAAAAQRDTGAAVPYLTFAAPHGPEQCTYVTYEDAQSIADKGAYVASKGLGGVIIWTINQGHLASAPVGQRDPLLAAMRAAFNP